MRIAYLANLYPHTTHTFIRREIEGVELRGIEVERITVRLPDDELPSEEDRRELARTFGILNGGALGLIRGMLGVAMRNPVRFLATAIQAVRWGWHSYAGLFRHLVYFAEACVVRRFTSQRGVEHVHAHFGTNAAMVAMLTRRLGGPPYSIMIHGPVEWDSPRLLHIPEKVAGAAFITAISDFAKGQTYRWTDPEHWPKVHVVRCGVDSSFLAHPVSDVPDVEKFVMIGRLVQPKGHGILFQAAERLVKEGREFQIKLIGDGPLRGYSEQQIRERGLEGHVEITGWMDNLEVRQHLLDSRAMLLPSFSEGLPVVIMEALALARPVICTRIAGVSELVRDGESGWVVNAGSVDELTDAIRSALDTPVERLSAMGRAGREAVLRNHDAQTEADKLADLLRGSAGGDKAAAAATAEGVAHDSEAVGMGSVR